MLKNIVSLSLLVASIISSGTILATPLNPMRTADSQAAAGDYAAAFSNLKQPLLTNDFVDRTVAAGVLRRHTKILTEGLRINAQLIAETVDCAAVKNLVDESMELVVGYIGEVPSENRLPVVTELEAIASSIKPGVCRDSAKGIARIATAVKVRATEAERLAFEKAEEDERAKEAARKQSAAMVARLQVLGSMIAEVNNAGKAAAFNCNNSNHCNKAFAIAQIFLSENVPMKIESANDTIVSTFQPTRAEFFHSKIVKMPKSGSRSEIRLTLTCRSDINNEQDLMKCHLGRKTVYEKFLPYMKSNVQL